MRTQVGIIGAGPAGLLLARILQVHGIESVVLEGRSRDHVLARIRAGVLEQGTVDTLNEYGVGERLMHEGIPHAEMQLRWAGRRHALPLVDETNRRMTTYGQAKVVRDLIDLRETDHLPLLFDAPVESLEDVNSDRPRIRFAHDGQQRTLECDFIAGCDGFHGVSRQYSPDAEEKSALREYPYGWFGVLVEAAPNPEIRGFAHTTRGAAVCSARSKTIGRLYLQVDPNENLDAWSDDDIWNELDLRMQDGSNNRLNRGRILQRDFARLRAFVCESMRYGRLCIAGDAAHIVPPSGAKGLNLAVGDVRVLAEALRRFLTKGDTDLIDRYSEICLRRIWHSVHWSCLLTDAIHMAPGQSRFDTQMQYEALQHWVYTEIGRKHFVSSMLGLPYEV
jgi:p-hydroxybenzoate 3-monooxygenase